MWLVQHICKFFCFGCYVQNFFFHFLDFILSYHLNLSLFETFRFHSRTSHPLKKVRLEKSGLTLPRFGLLFIYLLSAAYLTSVHAKLNLTQMKQEFKYVWFM